MTNHDLIELIERHCRAHAISQSTFGRIAVNDGKLVERLRAGRSITLATLEKVMAAINAGAAHSDRGAA